MSKNSGINWKTFFVSVLGTAIGVALTFSLNGFREGKQREQAQRLTAIMVIHDIDKTVEDLKNARDNEQILNDYSKYVLKHENKLETVSIDTLYQLVSMISRSSVAFRFDTSKERIFHSSLDSWQNLGDAKFKDNVQSFYFERQGYQDILDNSPVWLEPLTDDITYHLYAKYGISDYDGFFKELCSYLKNKLKDKDVRAFLTLSDQRISTLNRYIDEWTRMNDENKFLMGISDAEMEDYINSIKEIGKPVRERELAGIWIHSQEDGNTNEYEFRRDHSFTLTRNSSQLWQTSNWSGKFKYHMILGGIWTLQGDSLVMTHNPESFELDLDTSELNPVKGKADSLARWASNYREKSLTEQKAALEKDPRSAIKARLDPSNDKMEWTSPSGKIIYVKRKTI